MKNVLCPLGIFGKKMISVSLFPLEKLKRRKASKTVNFILLYKSTTISIFYAFSIIEKT